jgi:hypothetical protein
MRSDTGFQLPVFSFQMEARVPHWFPSRIHCISNGTHDAGPGALAVTAQCAVPSFPAAAWRKASGRSPAPSAE